MTPLRLVSDAPAEATSMPDGDRLEGDLRFFLALGIALAGWIGVAVLVVAL